MTHTQRFVALRKESVDRNLFALPGKAVTTRSLSARRAWIEMLTSVVSSAGTTGSLSARRAWIEMPCIDIVHTKQAVALRKESVDRNIIESGITKKICQSLSARRAWIEITVLRKGLLINLCRSPQGERG